MPEEDKYLRKSDYQGALDAQSACNLSGIVRTFASVTERICEEARRSNQGTDFVNNHPICRLYAEQILNLSGGGTGKYETYSDAYAACEKGASGA